MERKQGLLTMEERIIIETLLKEGYSEKDAALRIGRDRRTVEREVDRNSGAVGYRANEAQRLATARRKRPRYKKCTKEVLQHVRRRLRKKHSPEQISETMEADTGVKISFRRIYDFIAEDKASDGSLYKELRIANGRPRRPKKQRGDAGCKYIPNRVDIEFRPQIVNSRRRFGDWEADLVCGVHHQGFLVTLVERKSRLTLIGHVKFKTAKAVSMEIIRLLLPHKKRVHTITYDNGREFCYHEIINKKLKCKSYFAKPYHSWERGTNENTNGLIRQYLPKGSDLRKVQQEQLTRIMNGLNTRPRKVLSYRTPEAVWPMAA
jgi:IS30 family transposase